MINRKATYLTSVHTSFIICKMGMITVKVKLNKIICPKCLVQVHDSLPQTHRILQGFLHFRKIVTFICCLFCNP